MGLPDLTAWRVESLRLTVFFSVPVNASGRGWWKGITGQEPETTVNRPQAGEYSESGLYLDGQLELKVTFNRADWVLSYQFAGMPGAPNPEEISSLSSKFIGAAADFLGRIEDPIIRVAYGTVAFYPVENAHFGNKVVEGLLPFVKFDADTDCRDLMIQVNNPCLSKVIEGVVINRISKLGVMTRQFVTVGPSGIPSMESDQIVRAEYDVSSAADSIVPLSSQSLAPASIEMKDVVLAFLTAGVSR